MDSRISFTLAVIAAPLIWTGLVCLASLFLRIDDKRHILLLAILPPLASLLAVPVTLLLSLRVAMCCSLDFMPYAFVFHAFFAWLFLALANRRLRRKSRPACPLRSLWFLLLSAAFTLHAAAWIAERTLDFALLTGHPL